MNGTTSVECDDEGNNYIYLTSDVNNIANVDGTDEDTRLGEVMDDDTVINTDDAECASSKIDEERELLLLEAAKHVSMARAQRALYQEQINNARRNASAGTAHSEQVYVFVVDYGQNMELPVYNSEQPGCTY